MENLVVIAIWVALALCGLIVLVAAAFGARSLAQGRLRLVSLVSVAVPALLVLVFYFIVGDWIEAGIWATVIMLLLTAASLLLSGVRGVVR